MKKIKSLTVDQRARISKHRQAWLDKCLSTERIDFESAKDAVYKIYSILKRPKPLYIYHAQSPMGCHIGGVAAHQILRRIPSVKKQIGNEIWNEIGNEIGNEIWNEIGSEIESEIRNEIRNEIGSEIGSEIRSEIGSEIESEIWSEIESEIRNEIWNEIGSEIESEIGSGFYNYRGGLMWASWDAFVSYFVDICGWKPKNLQKFNAYRKLTEQSSWQWWHENICCISDRPIAIHRDENKRLHNPNGKAIEYADGWGVYCLYGVRVEKDMLTYSPEQIMAVENAEQRMALIKNYGLENMLEHMKYHVIDKRDDLVKVESLHSVKYELIMLDIDGRDCEYLKMTNPSTGEIHIEGSAPGITTVIESLADAWGVSTKDIEDNLKFVA